MALRGCCVLQIGEDCSGYALALAVLMHEE